MIVTGSGEVMAIVDCNFDQRGALLSPHGGAGSKAPSVALGGPLKLSYFC